VTPYFLAIDQGTTGSRVITVDAKGFIKSRSYIEIKQFFPQPAWVEHDPNEILTSVLTVARRAIQAANISPSQIAAIGITNQRETVVAWDRLTGKPLHRAIVWQDRRTAEFCERLKRQGLEPDIRRSTGLLLDPYFSGTKLNWLLGNVPGVQARAKSGNLLAGTIDSWLLWNLTGGTVHATDFTNASRTLLFDITRKCWSSELLEIFGVPQTALPSIFPSAALFGRTVKIGPFPEGIPIYAMAGDQQAALFGQGCYESGAVKNTYGTGSFLVLNTGKKRVSSRHGLLTTLACDRSGRPVYALEGSIFISGAAVQWIRDGLGLIRKASDTEKLSRSVRDTGGVYVVPAFVGLGAPYWDSECRGAILGLTRGTGRAHLARAVLEAIAYQTADVIHAMRRDSGLEMKTMRVDGGASENGFLMQFQADILGMKVERSSVIESTAWGAAKLAACGAGIWPDVRQIDRKLKYETYNNRMSEAVRSRLYAGWMASVRRVLAQGLS